MSELTQQDIKQHLRSALQRIPDAQIFGFHLPEGRVDTRDLSVDDEPWRIVQAPSELAIRAALVEHRHSPAGRLAIVTPLHERDLSTDVRLRFPHGQLLAIDPWESLKTLFNAASLDWELTRPDARSLGKALLRCVPSQSFPSVSTGILDTKTAWKTYFRFALGFDALPDQLADLFPVAHALARNAELEDPDLLQQLRRFLQSRLGPATDLFFDALTAFSDSESWVQSSGKNPRFTAQFPETETQNSKPKTQNPAAGVYAIGLAAHTAFQAHRVDDSLETPAALLNKSIEKEFFSSSNTDALPIFAEQASIAFSRVTDDHHRHQIISELDDLLQREAGPMAAALAIHSPASLLGWTARLQHAANLLNESSHSPEAATRTLKKAIQSVKDHHRASQEPTLVETLENAARLANWLHNSGSEFWALSSGKNPRFTDQSPETETQNSKPKTQNHTAATLARLYTQHNAFADILREALTSRDPGPVLQDAIDTLIHRALEASDAFNETFARDLLNQLSGATTASNLLSVHQVLSEVVAPLARDKNILFIVLDGMSWSVAHTLMQDQALQSWNTWTTALSNNTDADAQTLTPVLATLPSITSASRTSLLTGKLQSGTQHVEKRDFPRHPDLLNALGKRKAAIFHKAELDAAGRGNIGPAVKTAIDDPNTGIVAVVVNAIDDQLAASEQVSFHWSLDAVTPLRSLLERAGDRTVILASDHGHIWETNTQKVTNVAATAARHRSIDVPPGTGELRAEGPMVEALTGEKAIVLPWTEKIRYTGGRRGYHGGASAQELITPLLILTRSDAPLSRERFTRISSAAPDWYRLETVELAAPPKITPPPSSRTQKPKPKTQKSQLSLLEPKPAPPETAPPKTQNPKPKTVVTELLHSPLFQQAHERYNLNLELSEIELTLATIHANNNRISIPGLANAIGRSPASAGRYLSALSRLLNLDGYAVLSIDRTEQLVRLNTDLLKSQFEF